MGYLDNATITNPFGVAAPSGKTYALGYHTGLDMVLKNGLVMALTGGTVEETGYNSDYGNYVMVKNYDGTYALYGHLKSIDVAKNDVVTPLTLLGLQGSTGNVTGPHLHLEIRTDKDKQASAIDPQKYISYLGSSPRAKAYALSTGTAPISSTQSTSTGGSADNTQGGTMTEFFSGLIKFFTNIKTNAVKLALILVACLLIYLVTKSMLSLN